VAETLRPFLREAASSVRELSDDEKWRRGYCPVCGAEPSFSKFEGEGGARYLLCSVCETVWQFQRVKCPFCANADADTLGFFFHEETPRYRIDFCRDCNRYIKGVDLRETIAGTDVSLRSEDVKTLYLDLAAEKKGFVK
jgi:FdhE protein